MNELDDLFGTKPAEEPVTPVCPPPGVYQNISNHQYHSWPAISSTFVKGFASLPSTCRTPWVPGDDGNIGTAIHSYSLIGKDNFLDECLVLPPECEGISKSAKAARSEFEALNPTKTLLPHRYGTGTAENKIPIMEVIDGVDKSLHTHPKVGPILKRSKKELSLIWVDEASGLTCKARLDIWDEDSLTIFDLKKCRSIKGFPWQMRDLNYFVQAGFYYNGAVACGLNPVAFGFIPVEAFPPYQVGCGYVQLDPINKLEEAAHDAKRLVGLLKESIANNYWPNFPPPGHIFSWEQMSADDLVCVY